MNGLGNAMLRQGLNLPHSIRKRNLKTNASRAAFGFQRCVMPQRYSVPATTSRFFRICDMIEKRRTQRFRVLKGGTVAFDGNGLACTVRNLSSGGAALDFASPASVPPSFMLLIEADQFIRRCHPVWRNEKRVGGSRSTRALFFPSPNHLPVARASSARAWRAASANDGCCGALRVKQRLKASSPCWRRLPSRS